MNLKDLLTNPDYVNANQETKKAIFEKFASQDENFVSANPATQNAIREKWGVEVSVPKPQAKGTVTIGEVEVKKPTAVVGPAIGGALGELVKGVGAAGELVTPQKYQEYPKKVTEMGQSMVDFSSQFNPATTTLGQQLQPGRDTGFIPASIDVSLVSESGTQNYDIQWISQ